MATILRDNLTGAWQVMLGRPEGLNRLDTSLEGFWRSFAAVILVAPSALITLFSESRLVAAITSEPIEPVTAGGIAVAGVALLADWFVFPVAFALLAPPFGLGSRYVPFIVARNWVAVIVSAMVAALHALYLVGVMPTALTQVLVLAAVAVALRFSYVVARLALAVSMGMALPIVLLELLLSLIIWSALGRFI